jgi:hypothetical protein
VAIDEYRIPIVAYLILIYEQQLVEFIVEILIDMLIQLFITDEALESDQGRVEL